ncbi:MAG: hypothetical protein D6785_03145 [Planctomycetota bacterium]|nr:MAG: hypothetical protein D6785_03145 [Planctomycetota bacterium]
MKVTGLGFQEALEDMAKTFGINGAERKEKPSKKKKPSQKPEKALTLEDYAKYTSLPVDFLKSLGIKETPKGLLMPYLDQEGRLLRMRYRLSLKGDERFQWGKGEEIAPYGLWKLPDWKEKEELWIVEGESDCHTLWYLGIPAIGIPGVTTWKKEYARLTDGFKKVYVIQEPQEGEKLVEQIKKDCKEKVIAVRLAEKDPSGLWKRNPDKEAFLSRLEKYARPYCTLEEFAKDCEGVEWLWDSWIPFGMVTLLVGQSGIGKSYFALSLCKSVIWGTSWRGDLEEKAPRGKAVWIDTEEAIPILKERAKKMGIIKELIVPRRKDEDLDLIPSLDTREGWEILEETLRQEGVKIAVLDSYRGAIQGDENSSDGIGFMKRLSRLARETKVAIIVIHHLRKKEVGSSGEITLDRVRGSSAIVQIPRVVIALDNPNPYQKEEVRVSQIKNSNAIRQKSFGFKIQEEGILSFGEAPEKPKEPTQLDKAEQFLLALLGEGKKESTEVFQAGEEEGLSSITLKRAKKELSIVSERIDGKWYWRLPDWEEF